MRNELTYGEWAAIKPLLPNRPRGHSTRDELAGASRNPDHPSRSEDVFGL